MANGKFEGNKANNQHPWEWGLLLLAISVMVLMIVSSSWSLASLLPTGSILILAIVVVWLTRSLNDHRRKWDAIVSALPIPFTIAGEPRCFDSYAKITKSLAEIVAHRDLLFQDLSQSRIEAIAEEMATLAKGQVVFDATETWRAAYQRVLETMRVKAYYSVAWVRTNDYWNDVPGRQSMRFNYELIERGFRIERVHILPDELWPFDEKMPTGGILEWLVEQAGRGIVVSLARESDLANEPDLVSDFAIYGDRAIGLQELDDRAQTVRFILSFDQPSIRHALARWERLALFARSFQNLMDQ